MKDAFVPPQGVQKLLDAAGEPPDEHDFDAQLVAQVDVRGRENEIVIVMLSVSQLLAESGQVMIVDKSDRAHRLLVFLPFDLDQSLADHVADQLRSVGIPAFALKLVELFQERFLE